MLALPARMVLLVKMASMDTHVTVLLAMKVCTVGQTQTSVPVNPARMVQHAMTRSTGTPVLVLLDMLVC